MQGGGGETETESLILWLVVLELLGGGWWLRDTYFVYLTFRTSALGMDQTVRPGKRNTLCCKSRMEMYFYLIL